jgi:LysR family transcriptional regulator, nod-box dependent transcriptional activator
MRFKGLDLNLLIALDALLTERNVSSAARKVFLSQSAMSGALARLREHFGDELLVPVGRRMVLTSAAQLLIEPLRQLVLQIEATVGISLKFEAAKSSRTFVVHASDYITEVVLSRVVAMLANEAPGVILEIVPPLDDPAASLESGEVDLLITPELWASNLHPIELLYEEQHVVVGWQGNPALSEPLTADVFFSLGHVVTRFAPNRALAFSESEIAKLNRSRRIELVAPSFTSVPKLLVGTHRIGVMHRRLAQNYAHTLPLVVQPLPFEMKPLREVIQYHQVRAADAGMHWLKGLIHRAATYPSN